MMFFGDNGNMMKKKIRTYLHFICFISLSSLTLFSLLIFTHSSIFPLLWSLGFKSQLTSSMYCDRTSSRTDICYMKGDIKTHSKSSTIYLYTNSNTSKQEEFIKPYPRKWEKSIMSTVHQLSLITTSKKDLSCDVYHNVPAVVFSTGGYTGNVYHDFNEGIIPLYITSQRYNHNVVVLIVDYRNWWVTKYGDVLSQMSKFKPIDFLNDSKVHCFPELVVGLNTHGHLTVDVGKMGNRKSIFDFKKLLDDAYRPRIQSLEVEMEGRTMKIKPKLVIISRTGSRVIENEHELASLAENIGFTVEVLRPNRTLELAKIYKILNSSDAMVGVHGAAMTHLLFMRPKSVFIQIVPLGTDWAANAFYGEPALKMKLWYMEYKIKVGESSLSRNYDEDDIVLKRPENVNAKGWEETKRVYLDVQNVNLDLKRFRQRLERAYVYLVSKTEN